MPEVIIFAILLYTGMRRCRRIDSASKNRSFFWKCGCGNVRFRQIETVFSMLRQDNALVKNWKKQLL